MNGFPQNQPSQADMLQVLQQIEAHLAALRHGAAPPRQNWLTVEEVAQELRLSRDSIERLIAVGRLQAAEVTGVAGRGRRRRYRICREWIDDFLTNSVSPRYTKPPTRRSPHPAPPPIDFIQ